MAGLNLSGLGKSTQYKDQYEPKLLFPVARGDNRRQLGIHSSLPFHGFDLWNAFEVSWLNEKGKPEVAIMEARVPAESPFLIESKSFKLYLNSFNGTRISGLPQVRQAIARDLSSAAGAKVSVSLYRPQDYSIPLFNRIPGELLDELDVACEVYTPHSDFLKSSQVEVTERLYSNLLKSNCPVTMQPDWGTVIIEYQGPTIDRAGLLQYIVSFRNHDEFHEQCVERMFVDIMARCKPTFLKVEARYTRRGGLDINPVRSSEANVGFERFRLVRQ